MRLTGAERDQSEGRILSEEYGVVQQPMTTVELDARAAGVYASNRGVEQAAGVIAAAINPHNESHLKGSNKSEDVVNAFGDNVLDAAEAGTSGLAAYEAGKVAAQGVDAHNPTMHHDAFAAELESMRQSSAANEGPAPDLLGPTPQDAAELGIDGLTLATAASAREGILSGPSPAQERVPGGLSAETNNTFADIMRNSGLEASFDRIAAGGAKMGDGNSLFGDKNGQLVAPSPMAERGRRSDFVLGA